MFRRKSIILSVVILSFSVNLFAGAGTWAGDSLKIMNEARGIALGESIVALSDDVSALCWNPAGLAFAKKTSLLFSYNKWMQDISYGFFGINAKPKKSMAFGLGINYLSLGTFDGYDEYDNEIGNVTGKDTTLFLGFSLSLLKDKLAVGTKYKYINQNLDSTLGAAEGLDIGLMLKLFKDHINVGYVMQNVMSTKMKFEEQEARLEKITNIGIALKGNYIRDRQIIFSLQNDFMETQKNRLGFGMELEVADPLKIRLGYKKKDLGSGIMGGFGIGIGRINLDYSISDYGTFDYTHVLSLRIGNIKQKGGQHYATRRKRKFALSNL